MILQIFILLYTFNFVIADDPCSARSVEYGTVCVCNASYCDTVPDLVSLSQGQYQIYTSSKSNLGFYSTTAAFANTSSEITYTVTVNTSEKYQTIIGFGGAFTDSFGINVLSLPEEAQEKLLESYFSDSGIEYSLCRVPVGGTDFSLKGYTYDDTEDTTLSNFSIQEEDFTYKIPFIKKAQTLRNNQTFKLFASAWSAPPWMKTNNDYAGFGWLKTEYYQLWADYFIKFFDGYAEQNINFWGLTTQNEPIDGFIPKPLGKINSMGWLPSWMNNWVGTNLGPTIRNSKYSDLKIILHDDNRILLPILNWFTLSNKTVLSYADGVAVHYYTDFFTPASLLDFAKTSKKDWFWFASEASAGYLHALGLEAAVELGSWTRAQKYVNYILDDIEYGAAGWVDWNLALDTTGGPTYIENYIDASVIVNSTGKEFYKQPMFYGQGHFSKFVVPGSIRLGTSANLPEELRVFAFLRPDNKVAVFIHNSAEKDIGLQIEIAGSSTALSIGTLSFNTILFPLN